MTLTTNYKQCFWSIGGLDTSDVGATARERVSNAAAQVQSDNTVDTALLTTSCGGYFVDDPLEISLLVVFDSTMRSFEDTVHSLTDDLNAALSDQFLDDDDPEVVAKLETDVRFLTLDAKTVTSVKASFEQQSVERRSKLSGIAARLAPHTVKRVHIHAAKVNTTSGADIPPHEISEGFSISTTLYDKLKTAEGDILESTILGLQKTLTGLENETKTSAVSLKIILGNIVTVGKKMWAAYGVAAAAAGVTWATADLATVVPSLISSTGGIIAISAVVGVIVSAIATATILIKDATNLLLVVNGQLFSIGVDCPNTVLGGLNSVVVYANGNSADAASGADSSSKAKDSVSLNPGTWYAARASGWGSVNYIVGLLEA